MEREKFPTLKGAVSSEGAPPHYTKDVPRPRYRVVVWAGDVHISTPKGEGRLSRENRSFRFVSTKPSLSVSQSLGQKGRKEKPRLRKPYR